MIEPMPPETTPPLATTPEPPPAAADALPASRGEPSLLSDAQRLEFAFVAGSLEGLEMKAPEPAAVPALENDFLMTPGTAAATAAAAPPADNPRLEEDEPPVLEEDFLAVPGEPEKEPSGRDDGFDLQSLAAALTTSAPAEKSVAAWSPEMIEDWDLPPMDLSEPAPAAATLPVEAPVPAPAVAEAAIPLPPVTATEPSEPLVPAEEPGSLIAAIAAAALKPPAEKEELPMGSAQEMPAAAAVEPAPSAAEVPGPSPFTTTDSPASFPKFPPPRAAEFAVPVPVIAETKRPLSAHPSPTDVTGPPEVAEFEAPLLFPAAPADRQTSAVEPEPLAQAADRGIGLVLCGALLILAGIFLACRVPALAMDADAASVSSHALAATRAAHLQGEMLLCTAGAAGLLLLGIGSTTLRRWAPPLIHAAGWVVLLTVLVGMGTATAAMFHLSANETPGDAVPGDGTALFAMAGIFGIALPLGLIALFQRPSVARLCAAVDTKPRWTDRRTVPALMVFITGLLLAVVCFALGMAKTLMPLFGETAGAAVSPQYWAGTGGAFLAAALLSAAGKRAGWWLLLAFSLTLTVSLFLTCLRHDWRTLVQLPMAAAGSTAGAILTASGMLPAILILLMTRRAFSPGGEAE